MKKFSLKLRVEAATRDDLIQAIETALADLRAGCDYAKGDFYCDGRPSPRDWEFMVKQS